MSGWIRIRGKEGGRRTRRSSSVAGWIRIRGEKGREKNPTVVQCGGLDPYERGKRGEKDKMPTVVQGGVPDPHSGKGGGGVERRHKS